MSETATGVSHDYITKNPRRCGGKACIDGTRIRVQDVLAVYENGVKPEEAGCRRILTRQSRCRRQQKLRQLS